MSYTTKPAHDLIADLHSREATNRSLAQQHRAQDQFIKAAVYEAWADSAEALIRDLETALPLIEAAARLVPETEERFPSLRDRLIAEEGMGELELRYAYGDR